MEIRLVHADEMEQAVRLSDSIFRDAEQISMGPAFPTVFSTSLGQSYGAFENGKLVSFMGLVPSIIRIGAARLNVFSLGSVCTHPDARGKGTASAILAKVMDHVRQSGASLLFVSGDRSLYTRANCCRFGAIKRFALDASSAETLSGRAGAEITIREMGAYDWFRLHKLASQRSVAYEQSVWDLAMLIQAEAYGSCLKLHHRVLVAEKGGDVSAFAVVGVPNEPGSERPGVAIEWAGDEASVAKLLAEAAARYRLKQLNIPVAWHETGLARLLESAGVPFQADQNQGTVYISDAARLIDQLRPYLLERNAGLGGKLRIESRDNGLNELILDDERAVLNPQQLVSLLFDPEPQTEMQPRLKERLADLFPVPIPYTSGLNYV